MKNEFCINETCLVNVLIYGGFKATIKKLESICPPYIRLRWIQSTRHAIPHTGFSQYDYIYCYINSISHSSCADVRSAARKRNIPFRILKDCGVETALSEILESIALRANAS